MVLPQAAKFAEPFRAQLDHWETGLSLVSECTEMLQEVQRQWMYVVS